MTKHSATGGPGGLRAAVIAALVLVVAGCTDTSAVRTKSSLPSAAEMYAAVSDDGFDVPAVPLYKIKDQLRRQIVDLPSGIADQPGVIVVDPQHRNLYFVQAGGTAVRYGIGVGREGFAWSGTATIRRKEHWPTWTPPKEMVERDPGTAAYADGMKGGLKNPLGARAMYLYQGMTDTLYRIHGTNDPSSVGRAVSSGCIRMINQDVIDLFDRAPIGTKVIVLKPSDGIPLADISGELAPRPSRTVPVPVVRVDAAKT